jgi:hypothetical protein
MIPVLLCIEPATYRFWSVPKVGTSACCPRRIHTRPISGLVLMSASSCQTTVSVGRQPVQDLAGSRQLRLATLITVPLGGSGPPADQLAPVRPAAGRLRADIELIPAPQEQNQRPAAPAAVEEAKIAVCLSDHPVDDGGGPSEVGAKRAAEFVPGYALDALLVEPLSPAIDGAGAAEQKGRRRFPRCDGWPGAAGCERVTGRRVAVLATLIEQRLAPPGVEVHPAGHGCEITE